MSLGSDIAGELPALRAQAESMMFDSFRGERLSRGPLDPVTGQYAEVRTVVYSGPGRLRAEARDVAREVAQGELTATSRSVLSLPVATSGSVRVDDVFTCVSSEFDSSMVGVVVRIDGRPEQSLATARRFPVEVESWPTTI